MTISSLAKFIAGVNRIVVENVEIENPEINPAIIIEVEYPASSKRFLTISFSAGGVKASSAPIQTSGVARSILRKSRGTISSE